MLALLFWLAVFVVSLFVLIKASDYFTESAEKIGVYFGLPAFIVGVTIVSAGTSLPELVSSVFAVARDSSEIVVGNVVGSNIANILLVLGVAAIISKKIKVVHNLLQVDMPVFIGSALLLAVMIWDGVFTLGEGVICIGIMFFYLFYTIDSDRRRRDKEIKKEIRGFLKKKSISWKTVATLFASAFFIYLGAEYTVDAVIELSGIIDIGKEVIAISAVALGTSLPELMVTVSAARKGKPEIAVGNVLGSNIFNSLMVMGVPALIGPLIIPESMLRFSLPVMIVATALFFFFVQKKQLEKWEGWVLLIFYIVFIAGLFRII